MGSKIDKFNFVCNNCHKELNRGLAELNRGLILKGGQK